jgi:hypothetical protein
MNTPEPARPALERQSEVIQLGTAAACLAGLLTLTEMQQLDCPLRWAGYLFSIGLPAALSRSLMSFLANVSGVFLNPVGWLLYPLGLVSVLSVASGFGALFFHLSLRHGVVFSVCTVVSFFWLIAHVIAIRAHKLKAGRQLPQTNDTHTTS